MQRDEKGRFLKRRAAPENQDAINAACSAEKIEQVLDKLHSMALGGDRLAGDLYLAYAIGKPGPSTESQGKLTWRQAVEQILNGDDPKTTPQ